MSVFKFAEKYCQPDEPERRTLGQGGASDGVERCFDRATGEEFAAKRLSVRQQKRYPYLADNEITGLLQANKFLVPRVVKFIDLSALPTGEAFLILELVRGISLRKFLTDSCLPDLSDAPSILQHEHMVMEIAAQLLQTVHLLHVGSNTAHLDITSSNIMHCTEGHHVWDQLRLIDFGFSQMCTKGTTALDVWPQGTTTAYAAPEVLYSLQLQADPLVRREYLQDCLWINGASADWWSLGIVLFELLIGELPFKGTKGSTADTDSSDVSSYHLGEIYCTYATQQTWKLACDLARRTQTEVEHPLLDKVR
ncbi:TPA: Ribosomal protein S6 kinase alpha-4, variant 2 [Trebouxia sp. C0006]